MAERSWLPFDDYVEQFLELVRLNQVVILSAETGSGKSTRAPLAILNAEIAGSKMICVTEPRRLATTMLAEYVAELHGTELGDVVGYQIAHDRVVSNSTKLVYKTEGTLLAELRSDPLLKRYGLIFLDEVHERSVNQDMLMALISDVLPFRPDLKVVISSATIKTDEYSEYWNGAPVLLVPGRLFSVDVRYFNKTPENMEDMISAIVDVVDEILLAGEDGDILVFMPDYESIMTVSKALEKMLGGRAKGLRIHQLYSNQLPDDRKAALKRDTKRRVFFATNIAETSVTIDGLEWVIDSGLRKDTVYVNADMSALQVTEHTQAGCNQRMGRVGRTKNGKCIRMFTEENFLKRPAFAKPEILRMSLDEVLLNLRCLDYSMAKVLGLKLMSKPPEFQWKDAESRLKVLGAISGNGDVTKDGEAMHRFKVAPMIGRMILEGKKRGCLEEIMTIAACLSAEKTIFVRPGAKQDEADESFRRYKRPESDALTMMKAWNEWDDRKGDRDWARKMFFSSQALSQIDRIRLGFLELLDREGIEISSMKNELELKKAIAAGLIVNLARKAEYFDYQWKGRQTFIFPGSAVMGPSPPPFVVCATVVESTKTVKDKRTGEDKQVVRAYMRGVHIVEAVWLKELVSLDACKVEIMFDRHYLTQELKMVYRQTWNGIEIECKDLESISKELIPYVADAAAKQISDGYGVVSDSAPVLKAFWDKSVPYEAVYKYGEERRRLLEPTMKLFVSGIAKKIAGLSTIESILTAIGEMTALDVLTGDALKAYQAENEAEMQRNREAAERRAKVLRETREAEEKAQAEVAPLRTKVVELDQRLIALGSVAFDRYRQQKAWSAVREPQWNGGFAGVKKYVDEYELAIERVELLEAPRFELTRAIYAAIQEEMPVCPVCGSAWEEGSFTCAVRHVPDRIMARPGQNDWLIGSFKTDREEEVARLQFRSGSSVQLTVNVRKNAPWAGRSFSTVQYHPNIIILPESLLPDRELILEYLAELDRAKKALEDELAIVADLKKKVATGETICLVFKDRGDGFMVAEYKREKIAAPADDLDRYPSDGESWWCHVIPSKGPIKIALYRKVGTAAIDVDRVRSDIKDLFPDLPTQLLQ